MNRYAYCHFCDDIRQEVGNKLTIVGLYNGEMLLPFVPILLPKLCIASYLTTSSDKPIKTLEMRVEHNGNVIGNVEVPEQDLRQLSEIALGRGTTDDPVKEFSIGVNSAYSPIAIEGPGIIRVVMVADGQEYLAGRLRIKLENTVES